VRARACGHACALCAAMRCMYSARTTAMRCDARTRGAVLRSQWRIGLRAAWTLGWLMTVPALRVAAPPPCHAPPSRAARTRITRRTIS
jgi:hypothetical protein